MDVYDHPTFHMACRQFDLVADYLQIPACDRERVKYLAHRAMDSLGLDAAKATAANQGFGNVGSIAAFSLAKGAHDLSAHRRA